VQKQELKNEEFYQEELMFDPEKSFLTLEPEEDFYQEVLLGTLAPRTHEMVKLPSEDYAQEVPAVPEVLLLLALQAARKQPLRPRETAAPSPTRSLASA